MSALDVQLQRYAEERLSPANKGSNVILPLRAQGMNKSHAAERAGYFLHRMELSKFQTLYPHELSGGMRKRVALARALAITPDILLLDEPFTGLDGKLRHSIRHLLETALEESRAAVLHVTHDPAELLDRTCRIIHLEKQTTEHSGKTPWEDKYTYLLFLIKKILTT